MPFDRENSLFLRVLDKLTHEFGWVENHDFDGNIADALGRRADFVENDAIYSPFAVAAHVTVFTISERPIQATVPPLKYDGNAMLAFEYSAALLHGAEIKRNGDLTPVVLGNRMSLSEHSYRYVIEALAKAIPHSHEQMVRVLYEQIVYQTNPHVRYGFE